MAYYLPSSSPSEDHADAETVVPDISTWTDMADLKIFWGPEICRLEYLLHLLDTGRIVDESQVLTA